jgi:hypothetical protein
MRWFSYFHDGILVFGKASLLASPSSQDHTDFGQCCGSKLVPMLGMPRIRNIQFRLVCSSGSIVGACQRCPMSMDVQHQLSAVFTFFIIWRFLRRVVWHRNVYLFCALQMPSLYTSSRSVTWIYVAGGTILKLNYVLWISVAMDKGLVWIIWQIQVKICTVQTGTKSCLNFASRCPIGTCLGGA